MPYNCTHNAFHNIDHHRKCYPFYSSAAALHDSPPPKKKSPENIWPSVYCHRQNTLSCKFPAKTLLDLPHVWKQIETTWPGCTVRGQNKHLAGRLEVSMMYQSPLRHHPLVSTTVCFSAPFLKYNLDFSHFQAIH